MATSKDTSNLSILVLPALSWPFERSSLRAAYRPTIQATLQRISDAGIGPDAIARLDIALILNSTYQLSPLASRGSMFPQFQTLLEETYSLVCIVAASSNIELDFPGGIDARIFLLSPQSQTDLSEEKIQEGGLAGPLVDVTTFARSGRQYTPWFAAEGEDGATALDAVLKPYWSRGQMTPQAVRLPYGTAIVSSSGAVEAANANIAADVINSSNYTTPNNHVTSGTAHHSVIVGGTFDHLHIGHKLLLASTVFLAEPGGNAQSPRHITFGITGDELLVNKKFAAQVQSWDARQADVEAFVEDQLVFRPDVESIKKVEQRYDPGPNGRAVVVTYGDAVIVNYCQISDPYGPTITVEGITALVISRETRKGGEAVNVKRGEKGWKALEVFEVDVLDASEEVEGDGEGKTKEGEREAESFEAKISSTEIRRRLAEREKEREKGGVAAEREREEQNDDEHERESRVKSVEANIPGATADPISAGDNPSIASSLP